MFFVSGCNEDTQKTSAHVKEENIVTEQQTDLFEGDRGRMVRTQLEARDITDRRVLDAMRKTPRHLFVPEKLRDEAYSDYPLPIGEGQTISQPYIVALMTQLLELGGSEKVLEIGTGSGYQAAILAGLCREVYTVEIIDTLAKRAETTLKAAGYKNITVRTGNGYIGWKEYAPFDGIIVTCAPAEVPQPLIEQLAEGGHLVIPVGTFSQELKRLTKINGKIREESIIPVVFVPMLNK